MTLKELRGLKHDIYVVFKNELCRVAIEDDDRYLLSNNEDYDGNSPSETYEYSYSWWLCDADSSDNERLHQYFKPAKRRPI